MTELIKITEKDGKKAVSARDLHRFLESKQDFSNWIKGRIKKYGLIENQDFVFELIDMKLNKVIEPVNQMISGSYRTEFILSMDSAKELSMVEGNVKGKQARQYFIECEKQLTSKNAMLSEVQLLLQSVQLSVSNTKAIEVIEKKIEAIEQKQSIEIKQDYFTILAYCKRNHIQLNFSEAIQKGKIATKLSKEKGIDLRQVSDEKYGYVNSYKESVLKETFQL
jgi:anti-repressor protein